MKLLIVEGGLLVAETIRAMLDTVDCRVAGMARESTQAFDMREAPRPDVTMLDIELPSLDGMETLRTIYERCPMPAVVLSPRETEKLLARVGVMVREPRLPCSRFGATLLTQTKSFAVWQSPRQRAGRVNAPAVRHYYCARPPSRPVLSRVEGLGRALVF